MNKIKKILLGAMSVLTLGLFVAVSAKVNAAIVTESGSNTYCTYTVSPTTAKWDFTTYGGGNSGVTFSSASFFGLEYSESSISMKNGGFVQFPENSVISIPVPSDAAGTITFKFQSNKTDGSRYMTIAAGTENSSNISYAVKDADTDTTFTNSQVENGKLNITSVGGAISAFYVKVSLASGEFVSTTKYDVVFDLNYSGSAEATSVKVSEGETASQPVNPERSGYVFDGWYTKDGSDDDWGSKYDFSSSVTSGFTLYAKWIEASSAVYHSVTFELNSSDYEVVENILDGNSVGDEWPANPRVLNKTFVGWFDGDDEYTSSTSITADTTLVAKFDELKNDLVVFGDYTTGLSTTATTSEHNFIDGVAASGSTNKKIGTKSYTIGDVSFNGTANSSTFVQCGEITFTLDKQAIVTFYATQTGNKSTNNATTYVINTATNATVMNPVKFDLKDSDSSTLITAFSILLPAGTYKTVQSGLQNWYGIRVNQDVSLATRTADVFAEKNTAGDTLRFIGGITGVTDLTKISSIELVLKKDGVATKKQIFLTTCYTSVTGASADCSAHDNVYYVIYRITGITGLTGTISKQLVVTFTDGQTVVSNVTEISL